MHSNRAAGAACTVIAMLFAPAGAAISNLPAADDPNEADPICMCRWPGDYELCYFHLCCCCVPFGLQFYTEFFNGDTSSSAGSGPGGSGGGGGRGPGGGPRGPGGRPLGPTPDINMSRFSFVQESSSLLEDAFVTYFGLGQTDGRTVIRNLPPRVLDGGKHEYRANIYRTGPGAGGSAGSPLPYGITKSNPTEPPLGGGPPGPGPGGGPPPVGSDPGSPGHACGLIIPNDEPECDEGDGGDLSSMLLRMSLGTSREGGSLGSIVMYESMWRGQIRVNALQALTAAEGLTTYWDRGEYGGVPGEGAALRQVLTPRVLIDVPPPGPGPDDPNVDPNSAYPARFVVRYYDASDRDEFIIDPNHPDDDGYWTIDSEATPLQEWWIEQIDATKQIVAERKVNGSLQEKYIWQWTPMPVEDSFEGGRWSMVRYEADGTTLARDVRESFAEGDRRKRYIREYDSSTNVLSEVLERYENRSGHRVMVERIVDPEGLALTTTWDYYSTPSGADPNYVLATADYFALVRRIDRADGSRSLFAYDDIGRLTSENHAWRNDLPGDDPADSAAPRRIEYDYEDDPNDWRIREVREFLYGEPVHRTRLVYEFDEPDPNNVTVRMREFSNPAADPNASEYRETVYVYAGAQSNDLLAVYFPDGRLDTYEREIGDYDPGTLEFTVDAGGAHERESVTHGTTGSPNGVSHKTTRTRTVRNGSGDPVLVEEQVYDGSGYETISWQAREYDLFGRTVRTERSDGTEESRDYGTHCCSADKVTDRFGRRTEYEFDGLRRPTQVTRIGAPAYGAWDAEDDLVTTYTRSFDTHEASPVLKVQASTVPSGGGTPLVTIEKFDRANRIVSRIDAAGLETTFVYDDDWDGDGRKVTMIGPGGATEVTEYYRDGRVKSVTGTGVVARYYAYSVSGNQVTQAVTTGSPSSPRVTTRTYDAWNRLVLETQPAFDESDPDNDVLTLDTYYTYYPYSEAPGTAGQLKKVESKIGSTAVQKPMMYEYDEVGNPVLWGIDVDGNDDLAIGDPNNPADDRLDGQEVIYAQKGDDWFRKTTARRYRTLGGVVVPAITWERLTGFESGQVSETIAEDIYGNETVTSVAISPSAMQVTTTQSFTATMNQTTRIERNGLLLRSIGRDQLATEYEHDGFRRQVIVRDSRGNETETIYNAAGQVWKIEDAAGKVTEYAYETGSGRLAWVKNPTGRYTRYAYTERGEIHRVWGDAPQPIELGYDPVFGERTTLTTYRSGSEWDGADWPTSPPVGDVTTWVHHPSTGLLREKIDAAEESVLYTYRADGKLRTRTWARGESTTYGYNADTGELVEVDYADPNTPDLAFAYNALGQVTTVADAVGSRTLQYDAYLRPQRELYGSGSLYGQTRLSIGMIGKVDYEIPNEGGPPLLGQIDVERLSRLAFGTSTNDAAYYETHYHYDHDRDRMTGVTGPGLPDGGAWYAYLDDARQVEKIFYRSDPFTAVGQTIRTLRPGRDLAASVENKWGGTTVSKYAYGYDELRRRTHVARTGTAFDDTLGTGSDDHFESWGYNDRNELTGAQRFLGSDPNAGSPTGVPELDRLFEYDPIGNRRTYRAGADPNDMLHYCVNGLNQYEDTGADASCDPPVEVFTHDADGNLLSDGAFVYAWDGENRLKRVQAKSPSTSADKRVKFRYDYLGRRVGKRVYAWNPNAGTSGEWESEPETVRWWVYYDWLPVVELRPVEILGNPVPLPARTFTWGLDLLGQNGQYNSVTEAGGIGGLLGTHDWGADVSSVDDDESYLHFYDANGNTGQLVYAKSNANTGSTAGNLAAAYEYDAYGNVTAQAGAYAETNRFRFSTKQFDAESGLGYWGYRYYQTNTGRWISRDPIEERTGRGSTLFVENDPINAIDDTGLQSLRPGSYPRRGPNTPEIGDGGMYGFPRYPNNPGAPTNGCTGVSDNPAGVDFSGACDQHDQCYGTCGKSKDQCDIEFFRDMLALCEVLKGGRGHSVLAPHGYAWEDCRRAANDYALGVMFVPASWFYDPAQKRACREWNHCGPPPPPPPYEPPPIPSSPPIAGPHGGGKRAYD